MERLSEELAPDEFEALVRERAEKVVVPLSEFAKQLDEAGIVRGMLDLHDNDKTAEMVSQLPDRLMGRAFVNPFEGMRAVKELERSVRELGFKAVYASPYRWGIRASDQRFYPIYAKAVELDIPVFVYTSMNYRKDFPMDVGRPLYLDKVAMDFPEMKIVASCGGWPWVPEMIGLARRHNNVYIDTSSHRPKHLATPGSGWEMLLQFGNTLLQDRIVFASGSTDLGMPINEIVMETKALPLKKEVMEKWLYQNAVELLGLK
ncbi:MAG: amidohydrolase [Deltaproteobacteria bacterium]|nr:amidohydrolase [Deltaproteobacteria bacterium]MBW2084971.1 amidohydrolase [Deltaproteobacteria bacterium]